MAASGGAAQGQRATRPVANQRAGSADADARSDAGFRAVAASLASASVDFRAVRFAVGPAGPLGTLVAGPVLHAVLSNDRLVPAIADWLMTLTGSEEAVTVLIAFPISTTIGLGLHTVTSHAAAATDALPAADDLCPVCHYDRRGSPEQVCPECGWEPDRSAPEALFPAISRVDPSSLTDGFSYTVRHVARDTGH